MVESEVLFPTPTGKLWRERNFYRDVWVPAERATGLDPTPHELRHSYAGHRVETMIAVYTHALEHSHDRVRQIIS